jgi:hypothetical protein
VEVAAAGPVAAAAPSDHRAQRGSTVTQVASEQGVTMNTLKSALAADFTSKNSRATAAQASSAADQAISGVAPQRDDSLRAFRASEPQLRSLQA